MRLLASSTRSFGPPAATRSGSRRRQGFTLVELLVVIAIIGVLVGMLLPAVQAARESARRTQCSNKVRQMMLAIQNVVSAHKIYPTGGIEPWPEVEDYSQGGSAFGPSKQGLSWAYQILPFLEEGAVSNLSTTQAISNSPVGLYFCPSRRSPTKGTVNGNAWLMDYASLQPMIGRNQIGTVTGMTNSTFNFLIAGEACSRKYGFWGTPSSTVSNGFNPRTATALAANYRPFWGVITRSSYYVPKGSRGAGTDLGYGGPVKPSMISDGTSKTAVIAEKRLRPSEYKTGAWYDDRGWSDGWDPDAIRMTACWPALDGDDYFRPDGGVESESAYMAGSAHPGGFSVGFADSSVKVMEYQVDLEVFNSLGNRADGK